MNGIFRKLLIIFCVWLIGSLVYLKAQSSSNLLFSFTNEIKLNKEEIDEWNKKIDTLIYTEGPNETLLSKLLSLLSRSTELDYKKGIADAKFNIARHYIYKYQTAKALEYFLPSKDIYQQTNDTVPLARALMQIGIVYYQQKNYKPALDNLQYAQLLFESKGLIQKESTCNYLLGIVYTEMNKYDSAMFYFSKGVKQKLIIDDKKGLQESYTQIAGLYLKQKQPDSALAMLHKTYFQFESKGREPAFYAIKFTLEAQAYLLQKNIASAKFAADSALRYAKIFNRPDKLSDAYAISFKVAAAEDRYKDAYELQSEYLKIKDSVFTLENSQMLNRIESNFAIEKTQSEIAFLEEQNKLRSRFNYALIAGLVLLLCITALILNRNRLKQKANIKLNETNIKLEKTLYNLESTQQQLIKQEKLASLGALTAGIAHEIKNPLNFINNFSELSIDLMKEFNDSKDEEDRKEIMETIISNLEKINSHGKRADSIIKNMLQHSRSGKAEKQLTSINNLCEEFFTLSFQGMRANNSDFNCVLKRELHPEKININIVSQDISRVLLNLFNNAFYAVNKKAQTANNYTAEVLLKTELIHDKVIITVRDNGEGIPQHIKDKIFEPFFTTKPSGEGTGLGLSLSFDIVKAHGGEIIIDSKEGEYTEFKIFLPIT